MIRFASSGAIKGGQDLLSQMRGPLTDAWDFLTKSPGETTSRNYPLKGVLATITRGGVAHTRWQYKPSLQGDARIWYWVEQQAVWLEQVHTAHPNETK